MYPDTSQENRLCGCNSCDNEVRALNCFFLVVCFFDCMSLLRLFSLGFSCAPPTAVFRHETRSIETSSHGVRVPRGSTLLDKELPVKDWIGGWHLRTDCFWDSVVFRCVQLFSDLFKRVKSPLTLPILFLCINLFIQLSVA